MKSKLTFKHSLWISLFYSLTFFSAASYSGDVSKKDLEVANKLAQGSISEVQLGKMVKDKATDPSVKDFASRMVRDHSQMEDQLKHWASLNGVKLPTNPSQDAEEMKARLAKESGKAYDREYIHSMLDDHKKDIAELQNFIQENPDSSLKLIVTQALPILENHMRVAQNVAGRLGMKPDAGLNKPEHPTS